MQKAKVVTKQGSLAPNGRERIMQVRSGEKGTGKQFGPDVVYWPWSAPSCDNADQIAVEIARKNDLELVYDQDDY